MLLLKTISGKKRLTGISLLIISAGIIIVFIPNYTAMNFIIALISFLIIAFVLVCIILGKAQSNSIEDEAISEKKKKGKIIAVAVFTIYVAILAAVLIIAAQPPVYKITDGSLVISTQHGGTINFADIEDVQLKNNLPADLKKRIGIDLKNILKGRYRSNGDDIDVFVDTSKPPYIYIYTKDGLTILNEQSSSETQTLYEKIKTLAKMT